MIRRPIELSAFEFAVISGLRVSQLVRGCLPRIEGVHKTTTMAQLEVAAGKVMKLDELSVERVR